MASTVSVMDPAWINYSPVVHKKRGDVPTSIYHHLLLYSYMTHLHICEAVTLARTCLALKPLIPWCQSPALTHATMLFVSLCTDRMQIIVSAALWWPNWKISMFCLSRRKQLQHIIIGVRSVLCVQDLLVIIFFYYQNLVYDCKGFHSSGSCKICSLDYVSSVDKPQTNSMGWRGFPI